MLPILRMNTFRVIFTLSSDCFLNIIERLVFVMGTGCFL
jgi:hypothetical protein